MCIVRFTVKDYDLAGDDFIGYYSLPFDCIQEGKSATTGDSNSIKKAWV